MTDLDLAELLCARLCHDLVNPVGAISMGLELVDSGPGSSGEEIALIAESTKAANAKLVFYRLAFGNLDRRDSMVGLGKIATVAHDFFSDSRLALSLPRSGPDLPQAAAKLSLLMLMVGASAAPFGGQMVLATPMVAPLALTLEVLGDRVALPHAALALVQGHPGAFPEAPREAHLALLPRVAAAHGAAVSAEQVPGRLALRVAAV